MHAAHFSPVPPPVAAFQTTSRHVRAQSTAPAAQSTGPASFLSSLLFDAPRQSSLDEEFAGVPATKFVTRPAVKHQASKLANGVKVISLDAEGPVRAVFAHHGWLLATGQYRRSRARGCDLCPRMHTMVHIISMPTLNAACRCLP